MRDYSNMTDGEFIKAYKKALTPEEKIERQHIAENQIKDGDIVEFTDELIDDLFSKYEE